MMTSPYLDLLHEAQAMENTAIELGLKLLAVAPPEDLPTLIEITGDENEHSILYRNIVARLEG
jgi:rubrerythrin